ncbi:MAG TPA: hypothetical protein VNG52_05810 [Stellaceae bacterium]|nr:hypothetical protein [Stellaceae bacterium]
MRNLIACLCLVASAALAGCGSVGEPAPSTARAIESDISAAHNNGPTAEQVGQTVVPDVNSPRDTSVIPDVTVPINNAY